ncbi:malate dehydrogenase, partial [Rhodococcus opacus M213]
MTIVSEPTAPQKVELTDEEIFAGHIGGKLSVETTTALDTQRALSIA